MREFQARYFDGMRAVAHDVRVGLDALGLTITLADGQIHRWSRDEVAAKPGSEHEPAFRVISSRAPGAQLVVEGAADIHALTSTLTSLQGRGPKQRRPGYWIGLSAGALAMVGAIVIAVDRLPEWAAPWVPAEWEASFGERVIDSLAHEGGFCRGAAGQAALDDLGQRLSAAAGLEKPVGVRVINWRVVNAFAVPGGQIGVLRGLIEHAQSGDEVAGVLAHEIGHVVHRHPTVGMLRQMGLAATVRLLLGGSGTGVQDAAGFGQTLLTLSYSRGAESRSRCDRARASRQGRARRPWPQPLLRAPAKVGRRRGVHAKSAAHPSADGGTAGGDRPGARWRTGAVAVAVASVAGDLRVAGRAEKRVAERFLSQSRRQSTGRPIAGRRGDGGATHVSSDAAFAHSMPAARLSVLQLLGATCRASRGPALPFGIIILVLAGVTEGCSYLVARPPACRTLAPTALGGDAGGGGTDARADRHGDHERHRGVVWLRIILLGEPHRARAYLRFGSRELRYLGIDILFGLAVSAPVAIGFGILAYGAMPYLRGDMAWMDPTCCRSSSESRSGARSAPPGWGWRFLPSRRTRPAAASTSPGNCCAASGCRCSQPFSWAPMAGACCRWRSCTRRPRTPRSSRSCRQCSRSCRAWASWP